MISAGEGAIDPTQNSTDGGGAKFEVPTLGVSCTDKKTMSNV